ncbi:hypothetical protein LJ753_10845 [Arthrobacter sp. zg-Y20]|uniref:hypothetical protein n=1 Tax=unclassified Arthrobacter TaxID=235627 RepID=UPI001D13E846|nr:MULTISPECIES: hypothetical protein [unclassified Arthrobacter]MCC3276367.1 hypothetical protein [Arthrobacter sp. zg-Y20]MDK1316526.1 hypothetical protein [Arthrobacter sp. zg.Y20]WIB06567.1 hypothetical protein QNO06_02145 [Arthrobacter sp. zg-Y20]
MSLRFLAFGLKSRELLGEVPVTPEGDLSVLLQAFGTGKLSLALGDPQCPPNWRETLIPWRVLYIAVDEQKRIVWHGVPYHRSRPGDGRVSFPTRTLEGYLLERYTRTRTYADRDQTAIAQDLASIAGDAAGLPLEYDCPPSGVRRTVDYEDSENVRLYDTLQELAALENGFNWQIAVEWADGTHRRLRYVFRTGYPYLGYRTDRPERVFSLVSEGERTAGNILLPALEESWDTGSAATHVEILGAGDGAGKPRSAPVVDTLREATGWVRLEQREQLSSGIQDQLTLDDRARELAAELFGGQSVLTITVEDAPGSRLADVTPGDSARVTVKTADLQEDGVFIVVGKYFGAGGGQWRPVLAKLGGGAADGF